MVFRFITLLLTIIAVAVSVALSSMPQTGRITLRSVQGDVISLDKHRGQPVVLVFNATWVPMANKSLPALQRIANFYERRGVVFYWVSVNSDRAGEKRYISDADLKAFAKENGLEISVLRDPEMKALHHFGLDALPSLVILDRAGEVWHRQTGFDPGQTIGYAEIAKPLNKLLRLEHSTFD
ncbi:MAG: TlpA family protein disulfide reductase [Acidobacteria bacterium]|nr:TlpA family protein disulfide reductase [Acidobacteriota bacterium]